MVENPHLCPLFNLHDDSSSESSNAFNVIVALINGIFLFIVLISNLLVVFVVCTRPELRSTFHVILASQASASVAVSLFAQPSLIAFQIEEILDDGHNFCKAQLINITASAICILANSWSVLGMAVNQYLALHFSAWYTTAITSRTVAILVILAWFIITLTCALCLAFGITGLLLLVAMLVAVFFTLLALAFGVKNYIKIQHCLMQVQQQLETPTNMQEVNNTPNVSRHQKTSKTVLRTLATCFFTYTPLFTAFVTAYIVGWSESRKNAFIVTLTLAYGSSCIYSAIYFRWNEEIRLAVLHILGF